MSEFTKEQIVKARKANLFNFLINHYEMDYILEGDTLHPRNNPDISIRKGYGEYKDLDVYGNSIDYLMYYLHYEFDEAVSLLLEEGDASLDRHKYVRKNMKPQTKESVELPYIGSNNEQIITYLTGRGISNETVKMLISKGLLYQDENNNAVFVNSEFDWGEIRRTDTLADYKCVHENSCLKFWNAEDNGLCESRTYCKRYKSNTFRSILKNSRRDGFWWFQSGNSPAAFIYICESAIDAISLYELNQLEGSNLNAVYVSIGGANKQAAIDRIKSKKCDRMVVIATDNDVTGNECRDRNFPDAYSKMPKNKDWNEDLIEKISESKQNKKWNKKQ